MRSSIALLTLAAACASGGQPAADTPKADAAKAETPKLIAVDEARAKLRSISSRKVQLWVVIHVRAHKTLKADGTVDEDKLIADALANAAAVVDGGADAIVIINSRCEMPLYERVIAAVREKYPDFPLAISALDYGPKNLTEGFRLAKKFGAKVVWCEVVPEETYEYESDDGKYVAGEMTPLAMALDTQAAVMPEAMHVAGVHMKYTKPTDGLTFPEAMKRAHGSVDGMNITGPKTGVRAEVDRIRIAHENAGGYPIGLASGVSVENIAPVIQYIDYAIVGTSLKEPDNALRTSKDRVTALRALMTELSEGEAK